MIVAKDLNEAIYLSRANIGKTVWFPGGAISFITDRALNKKFSEQLAKTSSE